MRKVLLFVLGTTAAFGQAVHGGIDATARLNVKAQPFTIELPNSSTGTTLYKLAKTVMNAGVLQAQITTTSSADQAAAIGCVVGGAGTSGNALIMIAGTGSCYFDAATTAGHIAVPSSTTAGALHDSGSTSSPTSGEVMATVGATDACSSAPCLIAGNLFMTPDIVATGGNGNGGGGGNNNGAKQQLHAISFTIDGGGSAITTGAIKDFPTARFACTINAIDISSDQTGSITVDIWKAAGAIPTNANKISASAPVTLSSSQLSQAGSLTGWTKAVSIGDVFGFSVASVSTVTHVVGQIWCQ